MSITEIDTIQKSFFSSFLRIHVLFHAAEGPVFGLDLIRELARHDYEVSPGTLYPILHTMEREGILRSEPGVERGKVRRYYRATAKGRRTLREAHARVRELLREIDGMEKERHT